MLFRKVRRVRGQMHTINSQFGHGGNISIGVDSRPLLQKVNGGRMVPENHRGLSKNVQVNNITYPSVVNQKLEGEKQIPTIPYVAFISRNADTMPSVGISSTFPRTGKPLGPGGSGSLFQCLASRLCTHMTKPTPVTNSQTERAESVIVSQR